MSQRYIFKGINKAYVQKCLQEVNHCQIILRLDLRLDQPQQEVLLVHLAYQNHRLLPRVQCQCQISEDLLDLVLQWYHLDHLVEHLPEVHLKGAEHLKVGTRLKLVVELGLHQEDPVEVE